MKYMADDGSVFESETLCWEYERARRVVGQIKTEVERYIELRDFKSDSAGKRAETFIMGWIEHDTKQNPERYGIEYGPIEEPAVLEVSGKS